MVQSFKLKKPLFLLTLTLIYFANCKKKLVFLSELCRHGARSPMYDNLDQSLHWNPPSSQLTQVGMRQHFLLGKQFNQEYIKQHKLLQAPFNNSEVWVRSTTTSRTQMSAQSQLYGWFFEEAENMPDHIQFEESTCLPPYKDLQQGEEQWNEIGDKNLPFSYQPVPTFGQFDSSQDLILEPSKSCPRIGQIKQENTDSVKGQQFLTYLRKNGFLDRFRKVFKIPSSEDITVKLISDYYDTLVCNQYQQIPFPQNMSKMDWDWIQFVYNFQQLYIDFGTRESIQLQATYFLNDLISEIDSALFQNGQKKFLFYSASDGNVNLLNVLFGIVRYSTDFFQWRKNQKYHSNAPFASTIMIEIYEEGYKEYFVQYKYNGEPYDICNVGSNYCPYAQFRAIVEQWTITDSQFQTGCEIITPSDDNINIDEI